MSYRKPGRFSTEHTLGYACISTNTHTQTDQKCTHPHPDPHQQKCECRVPLGDEDSIMFWITEPHCWAHLFPPWVECFGIGQSLPRCYAAHSFLPFLATWLIQYLSHRRGHSPRTIVYKEVSVRTQIFDEVSTAGLEAIMSSSLQRSSGAESPLAPSAFSWTSGASPVGQPYNHFHSQDHLWRSQS